MYPRNPDEIEKKIGSLLDKLTLEEKVSLVHASGTFFVGAVPRLGIPGLVMSDGPHGVRREISLDSWLPVETDDDKITYLPTGTAQAATWNPEMARLAGHVLGEEARGRGKDVILGPGLNLLRTPLCGRNFEYYGEDPFLAGKIAAAVVPAIQEHDVAACVKHFALNNQELDRGHVDVLADERTLREIYLPAFEEAIRAGDALTVMGAYNRFRGQHCCHHDYLVNQILKNEWGFGGAFMSDWGGVHDTDEAARCGMDIEMGTGKPFDQYFLAAPYLAGIQAGKFDLETLNDKVSRVLRVMFRIGMFDSNRNSGSINRPAHRQNALKIAQEAMVLLKNDKALLPLNPNKIKKLAVIGANATFKHASGGYSSGLKPFYEISPLEGIRAKLGAAVEILHAEGYPEYPAGLMPIPVAVMSPAGAGVRGWALDYFRLYDFKGPHTATEFHESVRYHNGELPMPAGLTDSLYSIRYRGELTVPASGRYKFGLDSDFDGKAFFDGQELLQTKSEGRHEFRPVELNLKKGQKVQIVVEQNVSPDGMFLELLWEPVAGEKPASRFETALEAARTADAVIFCGGLNHKYDTEGFDRPDLQLPGNQDALIEKILAVNPNTIIVIVSGSPVEMPWVAQAPAILQAWYAGMETGTALADILLGDVNPSGKLPFTFPKKLTESPAHCLGEYRAENCHYTEGLLVGYRFHDTKNVAPLFAFGHGLSYTQFTYRDLEIKPGTKPGIAFEISLKLKNTGPRPGAEVVQLYIQDVVSRLPRPLKELKGFQKIALAPGEEKPVTFFISDRDLSFFDDQKMAWIAEAGEFIFHLGSSSRDIRLQGKGVLKIDN